MTTRRYTLLGPATEVTSELTERSITVNPHVMHFLVPPTFSAVALEAARTMWTNLVAGLSQSTRDGCAGIRGWAKTELFTAATPDAFADAVDDLAHAIVSVSSGRLRPSESHAQRLRPLRGGELARTSELICILHHHGCLLAPAVDLRAPLFLAGRLPDGAFAAQLLGDAAALVQEVLSYAGINHHAVRPTLFKLLLAMQGVAEVGDLTPNTLQPLGAAFRLDNALLDAEVRALGVEPFLRFDKTNQKLHLALQRSQHARYAGVGLQVSSAFHALRGSGGVGRGRRARAGDENHRHEFPYITRTFPSHAAWAAALREHIANLGNRVDLDATVKPLDTMMRELLRSSDVPPTPLEFCAAARTSAVLLQAVINSPKRKDSRRIAYITQAESFFEYVLNTDGLLPDGSRDPRYRNPTQFIQRPRRRRRGQSHRRAMPPWLVRAAIECLTAADYEWPRTRTKADYFDVHTPDGPMRVWSPVLAELTLLRFMIPIRAMQARLLGSGEGDTWIWREGSLAGEGEWVLNDGPWRPASSEERKHGLLRRVWDPTTSAWTTGLYISTNKTADREGGFDDLGYEVGWSSPQIVSLFERVRRFQAQYNSARAPKSRVELMSEPLRASPDVAARLPRMHYLFRDPCDVRYPDEPVTRGRVRLFWIDLMAELERRFAADPHGPREDDGSPLRLVREGGMSAEYDLHSVRVTGITALAVNGCPLEVIMMLAGHATFLMTAHYIKPTPADLRHVMDRAQERIAAAEGDAWNAAVEDLGVEMIARIRVPNSAEGLAQLERERGAFIQQMDIGLCPNGGAMCQEGGPAVKKGVHGPVPGGASNCQSCRFLVSGPQYLGGLIARLNKLSAEAIEAGAALREAEARRREAVAALRREVEPSAKLASAVRRAESRVAAAEERSAVVAISWQDLFTLIRRCEAALHEHMGREEGGEGRGRSLVVLNGTLDDFKVQMERCTEFDLLERICEDADVYPNDVRHATRLRGARLDRVLAAAGRPAVFAGLDEEESREVGNLFARWLRTRLGTTSATEVIEGRRTLAEAGLIDDADALLAGAVQRVTITEGVPGRSLQSTAVRQLTSGADA